jgi:hypothetical protein
MYGTAAQLFVFAGWLLLLCLTLNSMTDFAAGWRDSLHALDNGVQSLIPESGFWWFPGLCCFWWRRGADAVRCLAPICTAAD